MTTQKQIENSKGFLGLGLTLYCKELKKFFSSIQKINIDSVNKIMTIDKTLFYDDDKLAIVDDEFTLVKDMTFYKILESNDLRINSDEIIREIIEEGVIAVKEITGVTFIGEDTTSSISGDEINDKFVYSFKEMSKTYKIFTDLNEYKKFIGLV